MVLHNELIRRSTLACRLSLMVGDLDDAAPVCLLLACLLSRAGVVASLEVLIGRHAPGNQRAVETTKGAQGEAQTARE